MRSAFLIALLVSLPPLSHAQSIDVIDDANLPRLEVATIKPGDPNVPTASIGFPPGRFVQENMNLMNAFIMAFGVSAYQVASFPDVMRNERFSINAKAADGASRQDVPLMVRALLIDRFKLRYHVEQKTEDAYLLTVAHRDGRFGPQLRPSAVDCPARLQAQREKHDVPPLPPNAAECGVRNGPGTIDFGGMPFALLVQMLSNQTGRQVVDHTGITGNVDVQLHWSLQTTAPRASADVGPATADDGTSIFTAVREQLGLKLENGKGPVDHIVIDHIERPSEN